MEPFRIAVPDDVLDDLHRRLVATILPEKTPGPDWSNGIPPEVLGSLVGRWLDGYSWREAERRLNRFDQVRVTIDGCDVHAVVARGRTTGRLPIVVTHGWPYSFASMLSLVDALDGELDVIVPSLPGYGFSGVLPTAFSSAAIADRWNALMTSELGYERYLTYGEDVGAGVSDWLAGAHPAAAGIIASHASFSARSRPGIELDETERAFLATVGSSTESGYAHQQGTRPDTLAAALIDSPSGLLAWIAEKVAAWSDGDGLASFDPGDILTNVMVYWVTRSIGTSFRAYSEPPAGDDLHPIIEVPASIVVQTHEGAYPRSLAEKSYSDIRSFERLPHGGHFTAWENPAAIASAVLALEEVAR
ncbi:epoxide hydrolase [Leifsonia shinshuensis]|uniref:epoxide hydrolase family protein n=1 Tax=Leifsonia shinshuensis TaxID=150026 RepID=UPI001F512B49|nr:epoxide hydrolase family protein [Leifsonia shinshuensis]MCI0156269.1 epoxide hydrolase [Leifsonia shinshuensis]